MLRSWSCARAVMGFLYMRTVELQLKIIWNVVVFFCSVSRDYLFSRSAVPCFLSSSIITPASLCRLLSNRLVTINSVKSEFIFCSCGFCRC